MYKKSINFIHTPNALQRTRRKQTKRFEQHCRRIFKPNKPNAPITDEYKLLAARRRNFLFVESQTVTKMIKRLKSSISEKAIIPAVEDYDFPAFFFNFTLRAQNYIKNNYLYPPLYLSITLVQNYWTIQLLHQRVLQLHHSTIFLLQVFMFLRYVINLYLTGQYTLTKKGTFTLGSPQWFQHLRDKTKDHVKKILTKKERKERKACINT